MKAEDVVDWQIGRARPDLETIRRLGPRRVIRAGDVVKIKGLGRGCVPVVGPAGPGLQPGFRVIGFRGPDVVVFGRKNPRRVDHLRTFTVDRIGARLRT